MPGPLIDLHRGDCFDVMAKLPAGAARLMIADLPYGTTAAEIARRLTGWTRRDLLEAEFQLPSEGEQQRAERAAERRALRETTPAALRVRGEG